MYDELAIENEDKVQAGKKHSRHRLHFLLPSPVRKAGKLPR